MAQAMGITPATKRVSNYNNPKTPTTAVRNPNMRLPRDLRQPLNKWDGDEGNGDGAQQAETTLAILTRSGGDRASALRDCVGMLGKRPMGRFARHPGVDNGLGLSLHLWFTTFLYCLVSTYVTL
jgi:hypothetical protein